MKKIYVYDVGIKPWEQTESNGDSSYATITVIQRTLDELFTLWVIIAEAIKQPYPSILKWLTVGHAINGSKVQEKKLVQQMKKSLADKDFLEKNSSSRIYSYVADLSEIPNDISFDSMDTPRYSILVFSPSDNLELSKVWETFQIADDGLDTQKIKAIFELLPNIIICRITNDGDTHVTMQFIGKVENVDLILKPLINEGVEKVTEDNVVTLINS